MSENLTSPIASARTQSTPLESIVSAKGKGREAENAPASPRSRYGAATVIGFVELADDRDGAFVDAVAASWQADSLVEIVDMT